MPMHTSSRANGRGTIWMRRMPSIGPQLFSSPDNAKSRYWVIDGRIAGLRLPTPSERELEVMSERAGP